MFENVNTSDKSLNGIIKSLSIKEEPQGSFYQTRSREDYETLLHAALNGMLDDVSVGRSGIYINELPVSPPSEVLAN